MSKLFWLMIGLILIGIGAVTDYFLFGQRDLIGYVWICLWEFFIFFSGVSFGETLIRDKESK